METTIEKGTTTVPLTDQQQQRVDGWQGEAYSLWGLARGLRALMEELEGMQQEMGPAAQTTMSAALQVALDLERRLDDHASALDPMTLRRFFDSEAAHA